MKNSFLAILVIISLLVASCSDVKIEPEKVDFTERNKSSIIKANEELFSKGILQLNNRLSKMSIAEIFEQEEVSTKEILTKEYGFSPKMIARFFTPFFSGIFLENKLDTSRRMFDFVFKMFGEGQMAVPNSGMKEIPKQLA